MREHDHKIHCMMRSGKPLSRHHADVLLLNAVDMFEEGRKLQRIKSRDYDGMIESHLKVIEYLGVQCIEFHAWIETERWQTTMIDFIIRVEDLDCPPHEWNHLLKIAFRITYDDLPQQVKEHITSGGGEENAPTRLSFDDLPPQMREYITAIKEDEYRHGGGVAIEGKYNE